MRHFAQVISNLILFISLTFLSTPTARVVSYRLRSTSRVLAGKAVPSVFTIDTGGWGDETRFIGGQQYLWLVGSDEKKTRAWSAFKYDGAGKPRATVPIRGAPEKNWFVYNSNRFGAWYYSGKWGYRILVKNPGVYSCTAHFAELYRPVRVGERVFNLEFKAAQGSTTFRNIDVKRAVSDFAAFTRTASSLVVTRHIEVLLQKLPNSRHGAIINGISCRRQGALPANVRWIPPPKVGMASVSIAPISKPKFPIRGPVLNGSAIHLNFPGFVHCSRFSTDPCGPLIVGKFLVGVAYIMSSSSDLSNGSPIIGAANADEEKVLQTQISQSNGLKFKTDDIELGIPIAQSGLWQCDLLFAELQADLWFRNDVAAGDRVFNVQVQDQKLRNYDIMANTNNKPLTKNVLRFIDVPAAGSISVRLEALAGNGSPVINALSCFLRKQMNVDEVDKLIESRKKRAGF